ncbi:MAG: hypothetical protein E7005_07855 [Alphaproteobacteria bacterium]|nr:hypothetical protein [Alphaproteobacteria bacterium]
MPAYGLRLDATGCIRVSLSEQIGHIASHSSKVPNFVEEAIIEIKEDFALKAPEKNLFVLYKKEGFVYEVTSVNDALSVSLTGQDYICAPGIKRITSSLFSGIFYKKGNKYELLWKAKRFDCGEKSPQYLSLSFLKKELKKVFTNVEISLGVLKDSKLSYIVWKVTSNEGIYYIPWHNGLLVPDDETLSFEEKCFEDLRKTYKVLRFTKICSGDTEFKVVCA